MSAEVMRQSWMQIYPHVTLVEMASCGHYPMFEAPVWLATTVESFLADK
jgi:pimeloyl-ACP methyl ester carboxylesterase